MTSSTGYPVAEVVNAEEKALAESVAFPTTLVFFTTKAAAESYSKSLGGSGSTTPAAKLGGQTALNVGSQAAAGAIPGVSGFFTALGQSNTWIRVAKVIVGGVMLIVGLAHISGAGNALAETARKVPLPI